MGQQTFWYTKSTSHRVSNRDTRTACGCDHYRRRKPRSKRESNGLRPQWWSACVCLIVSVCMFLPNAGFPLNHWGRVTHILSIIGSDNGLSPGRRQTIIWTNAGILLIGSLEQTSMKFESKFINFHLRKCISKCRLENGGHLVSASMCWPSVFISVPTAALAPSTCTAMNTKFRQEIISRFWVL